MIRLHITAEGQTEKAFVDQVLTPHLEHDQPIGNLVKMVGTQNPELINDGRETAPSKRIIKEIPEYDKVTSGVSVTAHIGLDALRASCKHFDEWVSRLEKLGGKE